MVLVHAAMLVAQSFKEAIKCIQIHRNSIAYTIFNRDTFDDGQNVQTDNNKVYLFPHHSGSHCAIIKPKQKSVPWLT